MPAKYKYYLRFLVVLLVIAGVFTAKEFSRVSRTVYTQIAEAEGRALKDRMALFLLPPVASLSLAGGWLAQTELEVPASKTLFGLFAPVLNEQKAVAAVVLSDASGLIGLLQREEGGFLAALRRSGSDMDWLRLDANLEVKAQAKPDPKALASLSQAVSESAKETGSTSPVWSRAHLLAGGEAAVSATVLAGSESGRGVRLSFAFALADLREACLKDSGSGRERVLIFSPSGQALDFGLESGQNGKLFASAEQISGETGAALQAWNQAGRTGEAFSFTYAGQAWWAWLGPLSEAEDGARVGLAIPQEDLLAQFAAGKKTLFMMAGAVFLLLWLMIFLLIFMRRHRQSVAASFFENPKDVLELIAQGESEGLEFKSTLRQNLASGRPGKEIELAALKTLAAFLNTGGGTLVVGVNDQGEVTGLAPDCFENSDHLLRHFSGLVNQHLGLECARYLRFALRQSGSGEVLIVRCEKSPAPVFLRNAKDEEFYIRVGPSSRKLSLSQFHNYLNTHKAPEEL